MSSFEFVFSLFGLLLGLALTEVLGGFVRTLKARQQIRLGYLTPLLGTFMMLHLTSFWMDAWKFRDVIPASNRSLLVGLVLTSVYYFAASLVFPAKPEEWPDLDEYFFKHKRQVLVAVLISDQINGFLSRTLRDHEFSGRDLTTMIIGAGLVSLAIFPKSKWANASVLSFLVLLFVAVMLGGK